MKILLATALFLLPCTVQAESTEPSVTHLDVAGAVKLLSSESPPAVLDLRTAEEFKDGHLAGAKNIDVLQDRFTDELAKLDKGKPYLVHCRSGGRSTKSLAAFKKLGFKKIYHLDGGLLAWKKAGQAVEK